MPARARRRVACVVLSCLLGAAVAQAADATVAVTIEPTRTKGLADLRLAATADDGRPPLTMVVRYDGSHDDLRAWQAAFETWWGR